MARFRFKGLRRWQKRLRKGADRTPTRIERNLALAGEVSVRKSQQQFKGSRTRAKYKIVGGRRVRRRAGDQGRAKGRTRVTAGGRKVRGFVSAPKNRLAVFTGQYRKSIRYTVVRQSRYRTIAVIGPLRIRYAAAHEYGLGRMPQRPVIRPGIRAASPQITRIMGQHWRVVFR